MSSLVVSFQVNRKGDGRTAASARVATFCFLALLSTAASAVAAAAPLAAVAGSAPSEESCNAKVQADATALLNKANELADRYKYEEARRLIATVKFPGNDGCPLRAWALAASAVLELREGHTAQAITAAEAVNNIPGVTKMLSRPALGINYFVLGAGYAAMNRFENADRAYRKSLTLPSDDPAEEYSRASRIYSDLCFIYMQSGQLRAAEESITKSIDLGQRANNKSEYVLRMDTLAHLHLEQGRISDALRESRMQVDTFGADTRISLNLRAHLYRDLGEICFRLNRLQESADSLQKCIDLEEEIHGTPDSGLTLATLAQVHTQQKRYELAEQTLQKAELRMKPFAADYPINAVEVALASGDYWQARGRWAEAWAAYARAIETIRPIGSPTAVLQRCFLGAVTAAHHLGNKAEERRLKTQMKELLASATVRPPAAGNVVDVLSLANNSKSSF